MSELFQIRRPKGPIPTSDKVRLRGLSYEELGELLREQLGAPSYRLDQVFAWVHEKRVRSFDEMSNVPAKERAKLAEVSQLDALTVDTVATSSDGTRKLRLKTTDGEYIESVLIPNDERGYTQCISSQVGCALNCRFCATASLGFLRNLHAAEIVEQVYAAQRLLHDEAQAREAQWAERVTNLVYMGMGEPLHNFNHVRTSLRILTHARGAALAGRRITVSTSGLVPAVERFGREGLGHEVGLAVSLNATTDGVRDEVMPINTRWNIDALLAAVRAVPMQRRRRITFEYVLLSQVNDSDDDARRLIRLLRGFRCHVNVIPFNPHDHAPYKRPSATRVKSFMKILRTARLPAYLRTPRGDDIAAACGQLALEAGAPQPAEASP